jgi:hypothetical protein
MKAEYSAETSVDLQRTTLRYSPDERTPQNYHCESLKSYTALCSYIVALNMLFGPARLNGWQIQPSLSLLDLRLPQKWLWRLLSSWVWRRVIWR